MKKLILLFACFYAVTAFAQDTNKEKPKVYLGVLTLTEKFRTEKNWTKADEAVVGEHFQRLTKYKNEGVVILAGRTELELNNPDMMGLVVFYAKDDKEAAKFMQEDPAVKKNIMFAKVHPYGLALTKCE